IIVALLVLIGGYGAHWSWIGVNGRTATLWDSLHLVLLPLAALVISLWLRHRPPLTGTRAVAVGALAAVFAVLVLAGYLVPWAWTGFTGNTVWDWLHLLLLPLLVPAVIVPLLRQVVGARFDNEHPEGV